MELLLVSWLELLLIFSLLVELSFISTQTPILLSILCFKPELPSISTLILHIHLSSALSSTPTLSPHPSSALESSLLPSISPTSHQELPQPSISIYKSFLTQLLWWHHEFELVFTPQMAPFIEHRMEFELI